MKKIRTGKTRFGKIMFDNSCALSRFFLKMSVFLCLCGVFAFSSVSVSAQDLPDKIRGYKVYDAKISVGTNDDKTDPKTKSAASVKVGEPELIEVTLSAITFELSAEISGFEQSGTVDFLTFRDFRVNDLPVEIEDYTESFEFKKNQSVKLPKPARISLGAAQALRGAIRESKQSKPEWLVTGRVFVFGRFKKFGFSFKRVVPVAVNIKIKNPLAQTNVSSN